VPELLLWLPLVPLDELEGYVSDDERPVGDKPEPERFRDDWALLTIGPSWIFVVCAIWPQPWPCERSVRIPGNEELELALELADVLVVLVPEAARGPPRNAAFHWAGVAHPVTPAFFSASAAMAIAMYVSP
jgi:hypothetical protein